MIYPILNTISQYFDLIPLSILTGDKFGHCISRAVLVKVLLKKNHSYHKTSLILNTTISKVKALAERFRQNEYVDNIADNVYWQHIDKDLNELSTV